MEERLQKYMARCGVASRRKCEEIITSGLVFVNDERITELGTKVIEGKDKIVYLDKEIKPETTKKYIMLNKPEGYICSVKDEKGRKTILDIVKTEERIYPIGRLDYDSSGLILLTNDGDIYNKIIHPRVQIDKKYIALVEGRFTEEQIKTFEAGVDIGDYVTSNASFEELSFDNGLSTIEIIIHEGKNRQIRKMCEALGHSVVELKRVQIGELQLGFLRKGSFRDLTEQEVNYINSL